MTEFTSIDDTIAINGFTLSCELIADSCHGAPWDEECGHGPVSEWTRRAKLPGELVLCEDGQSKRLYDFAEACRIARRENWDAKPYNLGQQTKRQQAAKAALADYKRMRDWCLGNWNYVGVCVVARKCGIELGNALLWGIESDACDYLVGVANELIDEAMGAAMAQIESLAA